MGRSPNPKPQLNDLCQKFAILANCNRLAIVFHLIDREMGVGELAEAVGLSQSALSPHLQKMREAGLVAGRRHRQMR